MTPKFFLLAIFIVAGWLAPLHARSNSSDSMMDRVIAFYTDKPSMSAAFEQSVVVKSPHRVLKRKGRVYFRRPGMMRWDYKWPDEVYYVSDGRTFWAYDVDEEVVYKTDVSKSNLFFALKFLFNFKGIYDEFECKTLKSSDPGIVVVQLAPKRALPVKSLEISYVANTGEVTQTVVTDSLGNRSVVKFTGRKYTEIPVKVFDFKVPKGVPVQDLQKQGVAPTRPPKSVPDANSKPGPVAKPAPATKK